MKTTTKKNDPKHLAEDEISYYYSLLHEELTEFDCGELCKPDNDGIPFCCISDNAVPTLYRSEFSMLKKRTDLWKVWNPKTEADKKMLSEYDSKETLFCECKGIQFCERENRSISCRTFPLEPYLDTRGVLVGLVFMKEFTGKCPLTLRAKDIRQEFIDSHFIFWEKLLFRLDTEYEVFWNSSKSYRRSRAKTGIKFPIFFPSHLQGKEYLKQYL
ncbi:hypothetical protein B2G51_03715 [Leptospira santarosai]|nr:hypothetical protein B2G51_03715 [Leptospira santarosai]